MKWKNRILEKEERRKKHHREHENSIVPGLVFEGLVSSPGLRWAWIDPTPIALLPKVHMASLLCWIPSVPGTFLSRYPISLTSPTSWIFLLLFRLHTHRFTNHSLSTSHNTCCWASWDSSETLEQALMINPITSAS